MGNNPTNATDPTGLQAIAEYNGQIAGNLEVVKAAIAYGGDKPVSFAIGIRNGQVLNGLSGSPELNYKGEGNEYSISPKGINFHAKSSPSPPLTKPKIPGVAEFEFLVVSTAKTPNIVASFDTAIYGAVATELALIANYAVTDDTSTLVEVDFHEKIKAINVEWASHGFAIRNPTRPTFSPLGSSTGTSSPPEPQTPSAPGHGGPPDPSGPPDDGDDNGDGEDTSHDCVSASPLSGVSFDLSRTYLRTPYVTKTTPAFLDPSVFRLLNRVIGIRPR